MKIVLISEDRQKLQSMAHSLEALPHQVVGVQSGPARVMQIVEEQHADLLLVEGWCASRDLQQLEQLGARFPQLPVMLTCEQPAPEFLLQAMRVGVREVLPGPISPESLQQAVQRIASKLGSAANPGKVLAFMPCKGGSGATFIATNLGHQLAQQKKVLLIDLNLQFGDALSFLHDGKPSLTVADVAANIRRMDASYLAASTVRVGPDYSVLAAPEDPASSVEVKPEHVDAIIELAVTQYDFVLLDLPRQLDAFTLRALDRAWRIYPVLQANVPGIRNAARLIAACRALNYPPERVEAVVNRHERAGELSLEDIRRAVGEVQLRTVPNSWKDVTAAVNQGNPLATLARSSQVARKLAEFAASLSPNQGDSGGMFGRLFKWA